MLYKTLCLQFKSKLVMVKINERISSFFGNKTNFPFFLGGHFVKNTRCKNQSIKGDSMYKNWLVFVLGENWPIKYHGWLSTRCKTSWYCIARSFKAILSSNLF